MVTLKSLVGFLPWEVFPICQQITVSNLFIVALSIFGDLLVPSQFAYN